MKRMRRKEGRVKIDHGKGRGGRGEGGRTVAKEANGFHVSQLRRPEWLEALRQYSCSGEIKQFYCKSILSTELIKVISPEQS